jgi:hypothetical protein
MPIHRRPGIEEKSSPGLIFFSLNIARILLSAQSKEPVKYRQGQNHPLNQKSWKKKIKNCTIDINILLACLLYFSAAKNIHLFIYYYDDDVYCVQAVYRTGGVCPTAGRLHVRLHQAQQVEYCTPSPHFRIRLLFFEYQSRYFFL